MKTIVYVLGLCLVLSSCKDQNKIAFVDNGRIVNEFNKKIAFEKNFQIKIDRFNKKADSLQQAIQIEAQLWQNRAAKMNQNKAEEEYQALLQKKQMQDFQLSNEEKELQQEGQQKLDSLVDEVKLFVKEYGETNGYTFILGANEAGSVMYGSDNKDITEEVLDALNGLEEASKNN